MFTLRTLGSVGLVDSEGNEVTAVLSQPKRCALLIYLALARPPGLHRRDILLGLFWPEQDEGHARNALSQSLSFLTQHLPSEILLRRGIEEVGIQADLMRTDVHEFQDAVADGRWAEALSLYRGDFLPGFNEGDLPDLQTWIEDERERLREEAAGAAWALAHEQIARGSLVEAERTAQRAMGLVWSDETPIRDFMRALAKAGDRVAALNLYERSCQRIRAELDIDPSAESRALAEAIRNGTLEPDPDKVAIGPQGGDPDSQGAPVKKEASPEPGPWKLWFWSLVFAAVVCFAVVGVLQLKWRSTPSGPVPEDRPFTVLADVEGTAPGEIRDAVAFLIRTGLDMAHVAQTVPALETDRTLASMDLGAEPELTPSVAREVAIRLGVSTVVLPRLDLLGDQYVLTLRVEDSREGLVRGEGRGTATNEGQIINMVDAVVHQTRRRLGENRAALAGTLPLPKVLTSSLEALKEYQLAREDGPGKARLAVAHLRAAVALDTAFATAWQLMASMYGNYLNEPDSAEFARQQVERFRNRLSEARQKDLELHRKMREDVALWDIALAEAEEAVLLNPRYLNNYSVYTAFPGGLPDSALNVRLRLERDGVETARRFNPELTYATRCFINTHYLAAAVDRMDEWLAFLESLAIELPSDCGREAALFESLAAGEWERADSMVRYGPGDWRWPTAVETALLQMVPLRGRIRAALVSPTLARPETRGVRSDSSGLANISHLLLQVAYGLPLEEAPEETFRSRGEPRNLDGRRWDAVRDYILYGVRESLLGDTTEARRVAERLRAMRDSATSRTFEGAFEPWFVLMEVGPGYQRGDWPLVVETLEPMVSRIHDPRVGHLGGDDYLCWWLLAEAHIHLGDAESAIQNLESILQRSRFRRDNWILQGFIHPPARLKLARLYAEAGNAEKAREHYRAFLDTFTDPDPDLEWMVDEAREGLASAGL